MPSFLASTPPPRHSSRLQFGTRPLPSHPHVPPTAASCVNLVERWVSGLPTKKLQRSAHRNVNEPAADIQAWAAAWNDNPTPFVWHKTAEQILERLADYCATINKGATE